MTRSEQKARIRRIGNGQGILIPKSVCKIVGMGIDDNFILDIQDGHIVLIPE